MNASNLPQRPRTAAWCRAFTLAGAMGLTGCAPLTPYTLPTLPLAVMPVPDATSAVNAADLSSWWTLFSDARLDALVETLLQENLGLQAAAARVDQARAASREAGAGELPSIALESGVTAQHQSMDTSIGEIAHHSPYYRRNPVSLNGGVAASWEIDLGRGSRHNADAMRSEAEAADDDALALRVALICELADAYLQLGAARTRLDLLDAQIANVQHVRDVVQLRLDAGASSRREVSLAQAAVARAGARRAALHITLTAQALRIDRLLGQQPGAGEGTRLARLSEAILPPNPVAALTDFAPRALLRGRPDVIAAERRLAASHSRVGLAVSEFYPKLSLTGLLGSSGMTGTPWLGRDGFSPQAGIGLRWRLFDFGRVQAEVDGANAAERVAVAQYRASVLAAIEDVQRSVDARSRLVDQSQDLAAEVTALAQGRDASLEAYQAGSITVSEVLLAEDELLDSRDALTQSRFDEVRALAGVYRSLGGGWHAPPEVGSHIAVAESTHAE